MTTDGGMSPLEYARWQLDNAKLVATGLARYLIERDPLRNDKMVDTIIYRIDEALASQAKLVEELKEAIWQIDEGLGRFMTEHDDMQGDTAVVYMAHRVAAGLKILRRLEGIEP